MTKDPSGYCHLHIGQKVPSSYRDRKRDDDASSSVASSHGGHGSPAARHPKHVRNKEFDDDDKESIADAVGAMRITRGRGDLYSIVFSYKTTVTGAKQTKGTGANNKVTRTQNELVGGGLSVHMRNGQDDFADDLRDAGIDVDNSQWMAEWGAAARNAKLVVCFADADYKRSPACMKELNYCKSEKLPHLVIDDYGKYTAAELADRIRGKLRNRN